MRHTKPLLALILTVAVPFAVLAAGESQTQGKKGPASITVGDFAVMLSATTGKGAAREPKVAADSLAKAGVPLGNPSATLSEAKLAEILGFYGVQVRTSTPDGVVSRAKAESALQTLSASLKSEPEAGATTLPSPASLDDCLVGTNHGQCTNCCKALGGSANTCSKFCFQIRISSGEPQP